jgi:hypothetical protein
MKQMICTHMEECGDETCRHYGEHEHEEDECDEIGCSRDRGTHMTSRCIEHVREWDK